MGIPKYFKWVTNNYDNLIYDKKETLQDNPEYTNIHNIDNLLLDTNGLIHPCVRAVLEENNELIKDHNEKYKNNTNDISTKVGIYSKLEKLMFEAIVEYIYTLYLYVVPKRMIYISIDGVAPRAKMEQQRKRRYRSYKELNLKQEIYKKYNIYKEFWDTNCITPGTSFMLKLNHYLIKNIPNKFKNININIHFSGSDVPGEGEHKIMDYLRSNDNDEINSIYGLDADLIMLSLVIKNNIYLLRESIHINNIDTDNLLLFSIKNLKSNIINELRLLITVEEFEINNENLIVDYIFMCFLLGNDFIPKLINLDINENSIIDLITIYINLINIRKNYLIVDSTKINFKFLQQILNNLYLSESTRLKQIQKNTDKRFVRHRKHTPMDKEIELINYYPIVNKNKVLSLGENNWQNKYYYYYFNIKNINKSQNFINNLCDIYLEGLQWTLQYYIHGCPSWKWYYPFPCAPCLKELCPYLDNRIYYTEFKEDIPFKPIEQLLLVIPINSIMLLPTLYQNLLKEDTNGITDNYPLEFKLDTLNNIWFHECDPILPIFNEKKLLEHINTINLNDFDTMKNLQGIQLTLLDNYQ